MCHRRSPEPLEFGAAVGADGPVVVRVSPGRLKPPVKGCCLRLHSLLIRLGALFGSNPQLGEERLVVGFALKKASKEVEAVEGAALLEDLTPV